MGWPGGHRGCQHLGPSGRPGSTSATQAACPTSNAASPSTKSTDPPPASTGRTTSPSRWPSLATCTAASSSGTPPRRGLALRIDSDLALAGAGADGRAPLERPLGSGDSHGRVLDGRGQRQGNSLPGGQLSHLARPHPAGQRTAPRRPQREPARPRPGQDLERTPEPQSRPRLQGQGAARHHLRRDRFAPRRGLRPPRGGPPTHDRRPDRRGEHRTCRRPRVLPPGPSLRPPRRRGKAAGNHALVRLRSLVH
jgi:hypothetical protein